MRRIFGCVFVAAFAGASASAGDAVDRFVTEYIAKKQIPGVALLVRVNGRTVAAKGYGMANLEHRVPVKPETVFQSGSVGKQFTAAAVLLLADEHKLALDDPAAKYLEVPESWQGIRIRHLLTHTSGLGDYPEDFSLQRDYTEDDLLRMIKAQPLAFPPGAKWKYSNLGYVTLGILIHKVSGRFYGDFLQERLFGPLGMTRTRIISEADVIPDRAAGYEWKDGGLRNQSWVSGSMNTTADGSLYFTILDLGRWDAGLDAGRLVSEAASREMWQPVGLSDGTKADYGFGWSLRTLPSGERVVEHGGAWQGFATYIGRYLGVHSDDRMTVVVLANRAGSDVAYIAHVVAGMQRPELAPAKRRALRLPAPAFQAYAGDYRLDDRLTIRLAVPGSGDRLVTTFMGFERELIPETITASTADFFEEDSDRVYRFERDAAGAVTSLTMSVPEKLVFRRVK